MLLRSVLLLPAFSALAVSQTSSDLFDGGIPIPTDVGCGGTVKLDSTTIIGSCSGSSMTSAGSTATAATSDSQQTGNGGIIHGSSTLGGAGGTPTGTSSAGGPKATGWTAAALGVAGIALALA